MIFRDQLIGRGILLVLILTFEYFAQDLDIPFESSELAPMLILLNEHFHVCKVPEPSSKVLTDQWPQYQSNRYHHPYPPENYSEYERQNNRNHYSNPSHNLLGFCS